ncbi:FAD-dependent protein [Desulfurobacterium indicum]|uniref:DNA-binding protein n=1 Tax=Desulfurobacterium indicum TaxID=1914305 RepID=A0A1R1MMP2_9BACT|nr:FAD-binding protein [Desulfurobacterium indicum]OMH41085.1 DNA-binding protein [Desulfurobacterium indicum]
MLIEGEVRVKIDEKLEDKLREKEYPLQFAILKKSIDARKKPEFVYRLLFDVDDETAKKLIASGCRVHKPVPDIEIPSVSKSLKVAVVGSGPAGLFAAYTLSAGGVDVVVFERGKRVEEREEDVQRFWIERILDENSNVQFGEGGAGTFSDGKLTTRVKDKKKHFVYSLLVEHGAPKEVLYVSRPHIGTDRLKKVIPSIRQFLENNGIEFRFSSLVVDMKTSGNRVTSLVVKDLLENEIYEESFDVVVFAVGNSARDTFAMFKNTGVKMAAKPFAVGVRIIHPQRLINRMQYGKYYENPALPPAEYSLTARAGNRGVFSFCMCPGGVVICSSSERETVVTNGMSNFAREGVMANSAIVVQVFPEDFGNDPFKAIDFQRKLEKTAFVAGGGNYAMPAQNLMDFLKKKETPFKKLPKHGFIPEIASARVDCILPGFIYKSLRKAFGYWEKRLKRFVSEEATVIGVETRTSSPLRILRDEHFKSLTFENLYPAGEGAGYAGGITSSAIDGMNVALSILEEYC